MSLAVPLLQSQIEAAQRLYARLDMWRATNVAFNMLRQALPGFDLHAVLIKAAAVNQLYGTNVYAIVRMAQHISRIMDRRGDTPADLSLVEEFAKLRDYAEDGEARRHLSFASKFAHFFISDELFPIYDSYAAMTLSYHLRGRAVAPDTAPPYAEYIADLNALQEQAGISCSGIDLDAYLWLTGLYMEWRKSRTKDKQPKINREVRELFAQDRVAAELKDLLPMMPGKLSYGR